VVGKVGTATVTGEELIASFREDLDRSRGGGGGVAGGGR